MPDIEGVSVSGSGDIIGQSKFKADDLDLNVSGSGSLSMDVDASGDIEADVSGSGDVEINVKNELDANISGSGSVTYKGNPSKVNSHASGSGKVRKT